MKHFFLTLLLTLVAGVCSAQVTPSLIEKYCDYSSGYENESEKNIALLSNDTCGYFGKVTTLQKRVFRASDEYAQNRKEFEEAKRELNNTFFFRKFDHFEFETKFDENTNKYTFTIYNNFIFQIKSNKGGHQYATITTGRLTDIDALAVEEKPGCLAFVYKLAYDQSSKSLKNDIYGIFYCYGQERGRGKINNYEYYLNMSGILGKEKQIALSSFISEMSASDNQVTVVESDEENQKVYDVVEQQPSFEGNLNSWLASNIKYPSVAKENAIQGRVIVQFIVQKDGTICNPQVVRGIDDSIDKEALRVVHAMPKWTPGKQNGKPVSCKFTLPVTFKL